MMAMVMDQQQQPQQPQQPQQQQVYKHYCRVCKKGFGCGRALGGHMRAHGINDDTLGGHADPDDDPPSSEWDDKLNPPGGHKRMYALRTNPNRLKSCRVCENCGKEFLSWKSFLEHGKCSSGEDAGDDSLASSPRSDADADDPVRGCAGWSKGKRSRRAKVVVPLCPSSEEEDLANCLVMLSAARVDPMMVIVEPEESCASASKEEDRRQHPITITATTDKSKYPAPPTSAVPRGMFECKACKKVFSSHQALGGHRASHKKVKGCFAAKLDDLDEAPQDDEVITHDTNTSSETAMAMAIVPFDNPPLAVTPLKKKPKVHECSICHRVFTSGQALGGHKRCHWITSNAPDASAVGKLHPSPPDHAAVDHHPNLTRRPMFESSDTLDLNLPAPMEEDLAGVQRDVGSPLLFDMPAALYLKPWTDPSKTNTNTNIDKNKATSSSNHNNNKVNSSRDHDDEAITNVSVDEEADSNVKLPKLSDLKDINMGRESSPWLQVGIGSSTNEGSEP